jgi:hypothetical protein
VGVLIRASVLLAFVAIGCAYPRPATLRVEALAGATFVFEGGAYREPRSIPAPFQASFGVGGEAHPFEAEVRLPLEVAQRYGATEPVVLHATLYVLRAGTPPRGLRVPLDDDQVQAVVRGERPSVQVTVRGRDGGETPIARLVLRRSGARGAGASDTESAPANDSGGRTLGAHRSTPTRM